MEHSKIALPYFPGKDIFFHYHATTSMGHLVSNKLMVQINSYLPLLQLNQFRCYIVYGYYVYSDFDASVYVNALVLLLTV